MTNQTDQEKFTALRKDLGLTLKKLSDKLHMSRGSIYNTLAPKYVEKHGLPFWAKAMIVTWELMKEKK